MISTSLVAITKVEIKYNFLGLYADFHHYKNELKIGLKIWRIAALSKSIRGGYKVSFEPSTVKFEQFLSDTDIIRFVGKREKTDCRFMQNTLTQKAHLQCI